MCCTNPRTLGASVRDCSILADGLQRGRSLERSGSAVREEGVAAGCIFTPRNIWFELAQALTQLFW